mmetsp:Transcript_10304/g.19627  ORF Transcript_10304/g.19627 Transcript_10304/m.19627 type:complete len:238 (+) Transcript_10304:3-716(+)
MPGWGSRSVHLSSGWKKYMSGKCIARLRTCAQKMPGSETSCSTTVEELKREVQKSVQSCLVQKPVMPRSGLLSRVPLASVPPCFLFLTRSAHLSDRFAFAEYVVAPSQSSKRPRLRVRGIQRGTTRPISWTCPVTTRSSSRSSTANTGLVTRSKFKLVASSPAWCAQQSWLVPTSGKTDSQATLRSLPPMVPCATSTTHRAQTSQFVPILSMWAALIVAPPRSCSSRRTVMEQTGSR